MVYRGAMTPSTPRLPRLRTSLQGAALLLVLAAVAAGLALAAHPLTPGVPLDPGIPNEQALIAAGLSGAPGPGQPTRPFAVDRVLVDGAATYVQYHRSGPALAPGVGGMAAFPSITLVDEHGNQLTAGGSGGSSSAVPAWPLPVPLPAWFPWRPPLVQRGYYIFDAPLPLTTRLVVVHLATFSRRGPPIALETVRIPLDLRALGRQPVAHPRTSRTLTAAHGLSLSVSVDEISNAHLILEYAPMGAPRPASLTSATGRPLPLTSLGSGCGGPTNSGLPCRAIWVFPPQPRGTRLTFTLPGFDLDGASPSALSLPALGPWLFPFVTP